MFENISTISDLLFLTTSYYGEKTAFSYLKDGKMCSVTYSDFSQQVTAAAKSLVLKGITNSKISIASENSYECLMWCFAVPLSGNVLIMLDNMATLQEKAYMVEHSDTSCLIYSGFNQPLCDCITENNKSVKYTICIEADTKNHLHCDSAVELQKTDGTELSYIFYTSGTTGKPKGVMQSQINLLRTSLYLSYSLKVKDSIFLTLPLNHILPFANVVFTSMYSGGNLFISAGLKNLFMEMQEVRPYCTFLVPALLTYFDKMIHMKAQEFMKTSDLDHLTARKQACSQLLGGNLKIIVIGGAPLDLEVAKRMQELDILVINGYGLTETCGSITVNPNEDNRLGSIGRINFNSEAKTIDGELVFKNPYLFKGYYKDSKATEEAFLDEWFLSGDLGYIEDNYAYIVGRKKNLIVLPNGKNISPEELELELIKIEEIKEVVVCLQNGKLTAKVYTELDQKLIRKKINETNKKLASYKQIESVVFCDEEFPKTASRKIKRGEI
ncbi:long-chain-fatty-acid--CoA ligase FadD15 [Anaerotignum neopropionicum]|uniref:Long-chain-fatty-acid--CoA ligase FadD15 n=1 Tax=Anaerotignum neopropionicum TaxID=36847 RepID=A0A136WEL2_9FIRM|nr:AMP-binding protein [Anaerotignum neopropionicum]KXL52940.1 long-chain-fatty-acid--CoA ligase FadD15 [Anaerotignum neopropionicum]